jgi:hypothetical protein
MSGQRRSVSQRMQVVRRRREWMDEKGRRSVDVVRTKTVEEWILVRDWGMELQTEMVEQEKGQLRRAKPSRTI